MITNAAQERIQFLIDKLVSEGSERGAQVAVYKDGRLIVDAWAGVADARTGKLVDGDTLFPVFSTTKGWAATVANIVVERGLIDYDTKVAKVWPEFAQNGKENVTLGHLLSHSAGIPQMPPLGGFKERCNWEAMCAGIARLAPQFEPGSKEEYHAMTFGWAVGEAVWRVDGRAFGQFLEEEIKAPLGIEAMYVGIPDAVEDRIAYLEHPGCPIPDPNATGPEAIPSWMGPLHDIMNRGDMRRACIPATSGVASARAIARHYAALLPGGVDGVSLLPERRVELAIEPQAQSLPTAAEPKKHAMGYEIEGVAPFGKTRPRGFGHVGFGGSVGYAYLDTKIAIGFTRNLYKDNPTIEAITEILKEA